MRSNIQNRYSKDFIHKTKQQRIEKIYFRTAIKFTYIQSSLIKLERLS